MHPSTFEYIKPSDGQLILMAKMRQDAAYYAKCVEESVPDGPDKTYILRKFREVAMWVNQAISREPDGAPR